jgi:hypothetical protein
MAGRRRSRGCVRPPVRSAAGYTTEPARVRANGCSFARLPTGLPGYIVYRGRQGRVSAVISVTVVDENGARFWDITELVVVFRDR